MTGRYHLITSASFILPVGAFIAASHTSHPGFVADAIGKGLEWYFLWRGALSVPFGAVAFFFGALLPDIDIKSSTVSKLLHFHLPIEHRTWTHTAWIVFALLILGIWYPLFGWIGFGYLTHLFADSLSHQGLCPFYPAQKYSGEGKMRYKKGHILKLYHSGEKSEIFVALGFVVVFLVLALLILIIR